MGLSPYLYVNLTSAVCCFTFLLFIFASYFTKKNMDNLENKIYRKMLIANMITVIFYICFYTSDIVTFICDKNNPILNSIVTVFFKLAPVPILAWFILFFLYLIVIVNEKNNNIIEKIRKNENKIMLIFYLILFTVSFFHFREHSVVVLETGVEKTIMMVMNISLYISFFVDIFTILAFGRRLPKRKLLPIFMLIPIVIVTIIITFAGIQIVFLFLIETAMDTLMYQTIENPDLKLINQLQLAKEQAEKSNKAKSDFLSSMSHELRTPLNAIVGLSQMVKDTTQEPETKEDMNDILRSSSTLLDLVDGILEINNIEDENIEIIESTYNPQEVFDDLIRLSNIRIGDKPIELRHSFDNIPHELLGDKEKVKTIISNLLTNAVKYTEKGFIDFNVKSSVQKNKAQLTITVKDTGRGIKEDQKKNLFTKFYRLDEDKDSDIQGAGLGLALTKSIVELLEGKIEVDSVYGQGSTFTVTINQKIPDNNSKTFLNILKKNNDEQVNKNNSENNPKSEETDNSTENSNNNDSIDLL